MNTRRFACCSALILWAGSSTLEAVPPPDAPADRPLSAWAILDAEHAATLPIALAIDERLASASPTDRIRFALPEGTTVIGTVTSIRAPAPDLRAIVGHIDQFGTFAMIIGPKSVAGHLRLGAGATWNVRPAFDEAGALTTTLVRAAPPEDDCFASSLRGVHGVAPSPAAAGCAIDTIDVLGVFRSNASDQAGGVSGMRLLLELAILDTNTSFENSGANARVNLVHSQLVKYEWQYGLTGELAQLRDAYGADLVMFIGLGSGGSAPGLEDFGTANAEETHWIFAGLGGISNLVIAHEIGHDLGCCHAVGDRGGCLGFGLLFEYSNGTRFVGESGSARRTVMAYQPGVRITQYSNPDVLFDGVPTGIPIEETPGAHNVATINASWEFVAGYRCHDPTCSELFLPGNMPDCNLNLIPDLCEVVRGDVADTNGNLIPDTCECAADLDASGGVTFTDLLALMARWGACPDPQEAPCPTDLDGDGATGVTDIERVLASWGACW